MREFLKDVWMHGGEESRAITPENITGEKGRAAMSASHLGVGRKGSCCVPLESGETITLADIEGPGIIRHIWMTVPDKTAARQLRHARSRAALLLGRRGDPLGRVPCRRLLLQRLR